MFPPVASHETPPPPPTQPIFSLGASLFPLPTYLQSLFSRQTLKRGGMVGLVGSFNEWLSEYIKRKCRSFLWRARSAMKKKEKKKRRRSGSSSSSSSTGKHRVNRFQYDPWSYALNFDDGIGKIERADAVVVYVLWVKPE